MSTDMAFQGKGSSKGVVLEIASLVYLFTLVCYFIFF